MSRDTIAAIATGPAAGGVGIVRISGPLALSAARRVVPDLPLSPEPRVASFRAVRDAGGVLDQAVVLFFKAPASYTGEDVVELQLHGSPALLELVLARVLGDGVRLATPGEFTKRAFLEGRIDLAQAEAVADLVAAESDAAVRAAASQLVGGLSERIAGLREVLSSLQADVEAVLDFPEEADEQVAHLQARLLTLDEGLDSLLRGARSGAVLRRGARLVLYGPVNAGKSTLFNALVGAERALVDAEPGTTRDALEARLQLGGLTVSLIDTAGLRDEPGRVEALGIARAKQAVAEADVAVLLLPPEVGVGDAQAWRSLADDARRLEVWTKADLRPGVSRETPVLVSGLTGVGVAELRAALVARVTPAAGSVVAASERHVALFERASIAVKRALEAVPHEALEVVAGELSAAADALADVVGADARASLIDAIFQRFCIGK